MKIHCCVYSNCLVNAQSEMVKFSLEMVKTRSQTKQPNTVSITTSFTPNSTDSSSSSNSFFRSIVRKSKKSSPMTLSSTSIDPVSLPSAKPNLGPEVVGNKMTMIKDGTIRFLYRIVKSIPMFLGMIGGVHSLYQLFNLYYHSSADEFEPVEKLEVLVVRRSTA